MDDRLGRDVYLKADLSLVLGCIKPPAVQAQTEIVGANGKPRPLRQDTDQACPLPPHPEASASTSRSQALLETHNHEVICLHVLRLIGAALKDGFLEHVNTSAREFLYEDAFSAGIKGFPRMFAKMLSPDDHLYEEVPRPAMNLDIVRCLAVFETRT